MTQQDGMTQHPAEMRAMLIDGFAGPEAIRQRILPAPQPGPGELLVRMSAAGVNPADWKACAGWLPFLQGFDPLIAGFDGAGTVIATGDASVPFQPGDRVAFMSSIAIDGRGSWAELACCKAAHATRLPSSVSFMEAAALPVPGTAAREALIAGELSRGETLLVNGGSGGTGSLAIQLAKDMGARVAATSSAANLDLLRSLGAELALDYRDAGWRDALRQWSPGGVDLLLDTVGQQSLAEPHALIRQGGRLAGIETMIPDEILPDMAALEQAGIRYIRASANFVSLGEHLRAMVAQMDAKRLAAPPYTVLPISRAAEAMMRVRDGHVRGKLLLGIDGKEDWG